MLRKHTILLFCLSMGITPAAFSAEAEDADAPQGKPLWEAGLGVGALSLPYYRGAAGRNNYVLPVPYFVYRGRFIKADRNGARSTFIENTYFTFSASVGLTSPVDSDDSGARRGMPDLAPTFELGPALTTTLWRSANKNMKLDMRLPARAAFTIERAPQFIGWYTSPHLNLDIRDPAGLEGWNLGLQAGPMFATRTNNAYFYNVAPRYVTPTRPAYTATGGYIGTQSTVALSKRFAHTWVAAYVRYDHLSGAVFLDSPLVERNSAVSGGFVVAWVFGQSERYVQAQY